MKFLRWFFGCNVGDSPMHNPKGWVIFHDGEARHCEYWKAGDLVIANIWPSLSDGKCAIGRGNDKVIILEDGTVYPAKT